MMFVDIGQRVTKDELNYLISAIDNDIKCSMSIFGITSVCEAVGPDDLIDRINHYEEQYAATAEDREHLNDNKEEWLNKLQLLKKLLRFMDERK